MPLLGQAVSEPQLITPNSSTLCTLFYLTYSIYLERVSAGHFGWPVAPILDGPPSVASVEDALRRGPYGRCVWACDNDVVDHQVVNIEVGYLKKL